MADNKSTIPDLGYTRVFDDGENRTRVWDKNGFKGYEPGNTEKYGSMLGPVDMDPSGKSKQTMIRGKDGQVDIPATINNVGQTLIPAAVQMAVPEIPGISSILEGLSPAAGVAAKMGASTVGGTALDQLMNLIGSHGQDSGSILDSASKAGSNALAGIGLPELLNIGPTFSKYGTTRSTQRGNSGTSVANSSGSSTVEPLTEIKQVYKPGVGAQGQVLFGKHIPTEVPIPNTSDTRFNNTTSTNSSGRGYSTTLSDAGQPWWAKIAQMVGSKQYDFRGTGQPNIPAWLTALFGIGANATKNGNPVERR